jgi:hypothetical protein
LGYRSAVFTVMTVIIPPLDQVAPGTAPTTFAEPIEILHSVSA